MSRCIAHHDERSKARYGDGRARGQGAALRDGAVERGQGIGDDAA